MCEVTWARALRCAVRLSSYRSLLRCAECDLDDASYLCVGECDESLGPAYGGGNSSSGDPVARVGSALLRLR